MGNYGENIKKIKKIGSISKSVIFCPFIAITQHFLSKIEAQKQLSFIFRFFEL